jgi:hypothetical protein
VEASDRKGCYESASRYRCVSEKLEELVAVRDQAQHTSKVFDWVPLEQGLHHSNSLGMLQSSSPPDF